MATTASAPLLDQNVSKFIARTQKILINGKWVEAASGKTFPRTIPPPATCSRASPKETRRISIAPWGGARRVRNGPWSKITPSERGRMIWKIGGFDRKAH